MNQNTLTLLPINTEKNGIVAKGCETNKPQIDEVDHILDDNVTSCRNRFFLTFEQSCTYDTKNMDMVIDEPTLLKKLMKTCLSNLNPMDRYKKSKRNRKKFRFFWNNEINNKNWFKSIQNKLSLIFKNLGTDNAFRIF